MRREICPHGIEVDADCPECVEPYRVADPSEPPKNAAYWKRMAKRWEASANASAKAASDNAALANRYCAELEALKRGEFVCMKCGLRKDSDPPSTDSLF